MVGNTYDFLSLWEKLDALWLPIPGPQAQRILPEG